MRVLVACEFSGRVRDAFTARGHYAVSADVIPSESPGTHWQGDVRDVLYAGWDLMIAHPPCTFLANSGVRWLYTGGKGRRHDLARWAEMEAGAAFFELLLSAPIPRIAVENPIMHLYGKALITTQPDLVQTVQPWMFGHGETKATQLWLRGLPALVPTDEVTGRAPRVHHESPGPDRWKNRSRTYPGLAAAMADQWGGSAVAV